MSRRWDEKPAATAAPIRSLIGSAKDIRLMTIYGYTRLVGYDEKLNLQPDILESYETVEDRIFTFHLREGHKWSGRHAVDRRGLSLLLRRRAPQRESDPGRPAAGDGHGRAGA